MRRIVPLVFSLVLLGCGSSGPKSAEEHQSDLDRAVTAIEDRQESEYKIIEEQERIIKVLEGNLEDAKSEGMREKIRNDINEKRVIIRDAEVNLANQKKVLGELYAKRDSLTKE